METEKKLNEDILRITMLIKEKYPELSKYLEEMTETIPDQNHPEVNNKDLAAYYESLQAMLKKYMVEHPAAS